MVVEVYDARVRVVVWLVGVVVGVVVVLGVGWVRVEGSGLCKLSSSLSVHDPVPRTPSCQRHLQFLCVVCVKKIYNSDNLSGNCKIIHLNP